MKPGGSNPARPISAPEYMEPVLCTRVCTEGEAVQMNIIKHKVGQSGRKKP
jgi:hypothetical protein